MLYKGNFYFDKKNHPGECEIDEENHIFLTIHESDLNGYKKKIIGNANSENLTLYDCSLIDFDIGYYKYRVRYLVSSSWKCKNIDFNKHIQDFRFTFEPLDEWLGFKTIRQNENTIIFEIPNDIILYNDDKLTIKIKYFKEEKGIYENIVGEIKVKPYICVSSSKVIKYEKINSYIQMITRFFATLIGYSGNVKKIKFHKMYDGKAYMGEFEDELIINIDFSNRYDINMGYPLYNLRTYYNDLPENIKTIFDRWFNLYFDKKYKEAIVYYYSPYVSHTIEEGLLNIMKCLEKISIAKENKSQKMKKSVQLHNLLDDFYKNHKKELESILKENDFKKEYIKNIELIHEDIANSIVYRYDNRITLAKKIKDIDINGTLIKRFSFKHCSKQNKNYSVYVYLANTRNYYTHLDNGEYIIKERYIPGYNRRLEKVFNKELLSLIIENKDYVEKKLEIDKYLTIYDTRD